MENEIRIRRMPLLPLLQVLEKLYNKGADYIDISGEMIEGQDSISISVKREYLNPEFIEQEEKTQEDEQFPSKMEIKLSDDDLNQLI